MIRHRYKEKNVEIFLTIRDFPDYKISNFGRVFSKKRNTFITGKPNTQGYYQVRLSNNEGYKDVLTHRLVAEYFIPNLGGYNQIDHIDENKSNNFVGNLRWALDGKLKTSYGFVWRRIPKEQ